MSWPWWVSGPAIGAFVVLFAWLTGKALAVSSGYGGVCGLGSKLPVWKSKPYSESWRIWFLAGLPIGGLVGALLAGGAVGVTTSMGSFDTCVTSNPWLKAVVFVAGGAMLGFGARWANGCTSGHSIVGIAQGAKSSVVATIGFMVAGMAVANLIVRVLRG